MSELPPDLNRAHALFLDFDGTLVDIAPTPDAVVVADGLVDVLARLSQGLGGALALVSGRAIEDVSARLAPLVLPAAGSHGAERRRGDGALLLPGARVEAEAFAIAMRLETALGAEDGVMIERKTYSVAAHFRAAPDKGKIVDEAAKRIAAGYLGWQVQPGRMVVEIRPRSFSKSSAVSAFMREAPFAGRVPVFIGDDITDEDGMRAATVFGGYGIKVGEAPSVARYRLDDPRAVHGYLAQQADILSQ